jgi:membrane protein required for colicin V production
MYWLDTVILVLLGLGAGLGFWSGLLWQVARVISLGLSLWATVVCNDPATRVLDEAVQGIDPRLARGAAYIVVFLGVYLSLFLLTRIVHKIIRATHLEVVDRLLGGLLGAAKMGVVIALACAGLLSLSAPALQEQLAPSTLAPLFGRATEVGIELVPEEYRDRFAEGVQQLRDMMPTSRQVATVAAVVEEAAQD